MKRSMPRLPLLGLLLLVGLLHTAGAEAEAATQVHGRRGHRHRKARHHGAPGGVVSAVATRHSSGGEAPAAAVKTRGSEVAVPPVSESSKKQVKAVLEVLSDIHSSISTSQQKDQSAYNSYMGWCSSQNGSIATSLGEAIDAREQLTVDNKALIAKVTHAKNEFEELATTMETTKSVMSKAENLRAQENDKFNDDMQVNRQSLDQVDQAISIIGNVQQRGGFLQQGHVQHLELNEPGESSYVLGVMKGIKEKLTKTQNELQGDENKKAGDFNQFMTAKKQERGSLEVQRSALRTEITEDEIKQVDMKRQVAQNKQLIADLTMRGLTIKDMCETKAAAFETRKQEYAGEQQAIKNAIDEISKSAHFATAFLQKIRAKVRRGTLRSGEARAQQVSPPAVDAEVETSFVQVARRATRASRRARLGSRAHQRRDAADDAVEEADDQDAESASEAAAPPAPVAAPRLARAGQPRRPGASPRLQERSRGPNFATFIQQLVDGKAGRFDVAQEMVDKLIDRLKKEEQSEKEKFRACGTNLEARNEELTALKNELADISSTIEYKSSEVETAAREIGELEWNVNKLGDTTKTLLTQRREGREKYNKNKKDRDLATKVLKQAVVILQKYYTSLDKTSVPVEDFAQVDPAAPPPDTWTQGKSTRSSVRGATAVAMVEKVLDEVVQEGKEAEQEEKTDIKNTETLMKESTQEHDDMRREVTERVKRKATLAVQLNTDRESKQLKQEDIDTMNGIITNLHEGCDDLVRTFKSRSEARTFELSQMKDVLDILHGSTEAVRTGFLSTGGDSSGMNSREAALLRSLAARAA